ncbi:MULTISPECIES: Fe(3+)-hydroxamate ABC transporter permease FhuB [Microvirga]|uniref:Fe(3+)-hydroxamate ABC transporter permease FhuB n=1 Tax=Microvirga arabica TaxID=1128671 RepID=A0ABV6Y5I1_9HYPH
MRHALMALALILTFLLHVELGSGIDFLRRLELLGGGEPASFEDVRFLFSALPRAVITVMIGASLGLVGSVLQQAFQNRLVSPMTLGSSSGAWLALVIVTVYDQNLAASHGEWFSMTGAILATGLVMLIAGRSGIGGLPIVLAGMAINILLLSIASGVVLLNRELATGLLIWKTGDLTQTDWTWVIWLAPRLAIGGLLLALAPRPLTLLRLGEEGAAARGLPVWPALLALLAVCLWMTASAVTAVGVIGFIALLAPNIARGLGARSSLGEMVSSLLAGAALLLLTDSIALFASRFTSNIVPSGASAALIGAPALILLTRRSLKAKDHTAFGVIEGRMRLGRTRIGILLGMFALTGAVGLTVAPSQTGWAVEWPNETVLSLRWPRMLAALAAGMGMALAGGILQRLLRNPLASPDIMGMSQGATLTLVAGVVFWGGSIVDSTAGGAFFGSSMVLLLLIILGRRHDFSPGIMALVGISIAALMDALVQFLLASGSDAAFAILNWLNGSTYRVAAEDALFLFVAVLMILGVSLSLHRWLTLISAGDGIAAARGLAVGRARVVLLTIAALLTALVTAIIGPVAFVGLLAPHMAALLGARGARDQLAVSALLGAGLMLLSDWLARILIYPAQLPAGLVASVLGGVYFILLLTRSQVLSRKATGT